MDNRKKRCILVLVIFLSFGLVGFSTFHNPTTVYAVYLDGSRIGTVKSKSEFLEYINMKEEIIRKEYGVDQVYSPKGVEIRKVVTYNSEVDSDEAIYNKIVVAKKFTIRGIKVTITDTENKDEEVKSIYVLNKGIFDEALATAIKAFVNVDKYNEYMEGEQEEIEDTGSIIENIDLKEKVTYREDLISVSEHIFKDVDELTKYLLYGTLDKQSTYTVVAGDTISDVASKNKLNVQEFLIANPDFRSENNLLYENQEVTVGLINPVISVIVEEHSVENEEKSFDTEIKYDDTALKGTEYVSREGENGLYKVTKKKQYINGQLSDVVLVNSTEVKPSVSKVVVKGDKYVPDVADLSYWAWPTEQPYTITTYFEYRWGSFHSAIDIYVGHGSKIYAANNGKVEVAKGGCTPGYISCNGRQGNYLIINHNAGGYYTVYMHLKDFLVKPGDTVARGQQIATMGNTGEVDPVPSSYSPYAGTHLHFAVRRGGANGSAMNPLSLYR